ncbi:MAG: hypothetical protein SH809_12250 [Rhodothermales bacterium]|nr:hypothetical protein [Rhodothermales bacterium]
MLPGILFLLPVHAQDDAPGDFPEVYVEVKISAALYQDQLPASIATLEFDLAEAFVQHIDELGGLDFIVWKTGPAPTETSHHRLIIDIEGIQRTLGDEIRAHVYAFVAGTELLDLGKADFDGRIHCNPIVFDAIDEKFSQDPTRLTAEIERWMEGHLTDTFGAVLTRKFLGHIPLALITSPSPLFDFDAGTNVLPIPIRYSAYFPEDTTQFRASFTSSFAGVATQGRMLLRPTGALSAPGFADDILVAISCSGDGQRCFEYPNIELDPGDAVADQWQTIRSVLSNTHLKEMQLFMVKYSRRPFMHTAGGLITEETPGGM